MKKLMEKPEIEGGGPHNHGYQKNTIYMYNAGRIYKSSVVAIVTIKDGIPWLVEVQHWENSTVICEGKQIVT